MPSAPIYAPQDVVVAPSVEEKSFRDYLNDIEVPLSTASLAATAATPFFPMAAFAALPLNVLGAGIDAYQAYDDYKNGNYGSGTWNATTAAMNLLGARAGSKFLSSSAGEKPYYQMRLVINLFMKDRDVGINLSEAISFYRQSAT